MLRVNRLLADQLMEGYRAKAEQVFGYVYAGAVESKSMPVMPDTATDVGLIPEILADLDLQAGELTYGARQNDPSDYDIRNESYQEYWQDYWMKLCEETKADMEAQSGRRFEDFYQEIKNQIASNEFSGNPVLKLTRMLEDWFDEDNKWKARRIAVTESNRISNSGFLADTQDDDIVVGYEYLVSADACPLCIAVGEGADGLPRQVAKGSPFAQRLDGDPYYRTLYTPPLHPNCRCSLAPVLDVDETRFGPSAKIEKGKIVDPGGKPVVRPPLVEVEGVNVPEKPEEVKPKKPRKPRKPKGTAGVAQVEPQQPEPVNVLSEEERDRKAILAAMAAWRQEPGNQADYDNSNAEKMVQSYTKAVGLKKKDAIAKLANMEAFQRASGVLPVLNDKERSAIENKIARKMAKEYPEIPKDDLRLMITFDVLVKQEIRKEEAGRRVGLMNEVRDKAFSILAVEAGDRMKMDITPQPHKAYKKKDQKLHDARMKVYLETIERLRPAVGKGNTDRSIGFSFVTDSTLTYDRNNGYFSDDRDQMYVGVGDKVDESTVAHELGHAITIGSNKTPGGKRSGKYAMQMMRIDRWDNWVQDTSDFHGLAYADISNNGGKVLTDYSSDTGKNDTRYASERAKYVQYQINGRKHELPSVLLEMFYRNPVEFVRHIDDELQGVLFGMLDGSLRE